MKLSIGKVASLTADNKKLEGKLDILIKLHNANSKATKDDKLDTHLEISYLLLNTVTLFDIHYACIRRSLLFNFKDYHFIQQYPEKEYLYHINVITCNIYCLIHMYRIPYNITEH